MTTEYYFGMPAYGMTAYNGSSFQVKADATASSYLANTTGKLYMTAEVAATLAGITINLNAPTVLGISANGSLKAEWKEDEFQFSGNVAKTETAKAKAALQKTESALSHMKAKATALKAKATELSNHTEALQLYTAIVEA